MCTDKIRFNSECKIMKRDNCLIIVNTINGEWIRLTEECYDVLNLAIKNNLNKDQLISCLEDSEDKIYFDKLIDELYKLRILILYNIDEITSISSIGFSITHRCNLSCIHCSYSATSVNNKDFLSTDQAINTAKKIIALNPLSIVISGGEPMVRDDFFDIIDFIKKNYNGSLTLMTNGTLINEKNVDAVISYFSNLDISLDGVDEATCSVIRGKGVFNKVINTVKLLQNHGMDKITLSMVLTKDNEHLINNFEELNENLGTRAITRIFAPVGRGKLNSDKLLPRYEKYANTYKDKIANSCMEKPMKPNGFNCGAIRRNLSIDADGRIYPCVALQKEGFDLGNILDIEDPKEFFSKKQYVNSRGYENFLGILPYNHPKCKKCYIGLFCSSCPFYTYLYESGQYFNEYCNTKRMLYSNVWK